MTAQTDQAPVTDANHPDGKGPESQEAPKAKPTQRKKTKYEELGIHKLIRPGTDGEHYLGEKGRFKTGRDATLKRDLIAMVLQGTKAPKVGGVANAERAEALLGQLGWRSHLDSSRKAAESKAARATKAAESKAAKEQAKAAKGDGSGAVDRVEKAKAAKADANKWVDEVVQTPNGMGQVLRVHRTDEADIESPYVAVVQVRENPQDADSPTSEVEIPVSELQRAS